MTKIKEQAPDTINGFAGVFSKIMKDGALTLREKECIALGIGVAQRCVPCIRAHTKKMPPNGSNKRTDSRGRFLRSLDGRRPRLYTHLICHGYT